MVGVVSHLLTSGPLEVRKLAGEVGQPALMLLQVLLSFIDGLIGGSLLKSHGRGCPGLGELML